jgi:hypothetical protein
MTNHLGTSGPNGSASHLFKIIVMPTHLIRNLHQVGRNNIAPHV